MLKRHYPHGVVFEVDGRRLARRRPRRTPIASPIPIRLGRRRTPSALGVLERHDAPLPEDRQGIAISTFGKVIKRGWDWLGLTPATPTRISGLDRGAGPRGVPDAQQERLLSNRRARRTYLAYRKAIQEVVSRQLAGWGDARDARRAPRTVRLERDLERVLEDLADDFPLLRSLVDRRAGGQKRLPLPGRGDERVPGSLFANVAPEDGTPPTIRRSAATRGRCRASRATPETEALPRLLQRRRIGSVPPRTISSRTKGAASGDGAPTRSARSTPCPAAGVRRAMA